MAFLRLPFGGLGATYDAHLMLVGKHAGDFLLVLIGLLWLGVTAEALRAIIGSKSAISLRRGRFYAKFLVKGVAPPTILFLRKLCLMVFRTVRNLD